MTEGNTKAWVEGYLSKYLEFELADKQNPNSWIVNVYAKYDDILLGQVRYYARWRQYGFYPEQGTVFEKTCLGDIAEFCRSLNVRQQAGFKPQQTLVTSRQEEYKNGL